MKNIILIALLCLPFIAFSQEQKSTHEIAVNANFNGRHCRGTNGLCALDSSDRALANSVLRYYKDNTVSLIVDRTKITKEEEFKIIGQQLIENLKVNEFIFVMNDDFDLESEINTFLRIPVSLTKIPKGNYPLQISNETFEIIFKME